MEDKSKPDYIKALNMEKKLKSYGILIKKCNSLIIQNPLLKNTEVRNKHIRSPTVKLIAGNLG